MDEIDMPRLRREFTEFFEGWVMCSRIDITPAAKQALDDWLATDPPMGEPAGSFAGARMRIMRDVPSPGWRFVQEA